eukprot:scaffold7418_cov77-Cyclotella_meneghiniana.AAC.9
MDPIELRLQTMNGNRYSSRGGGGGASVNKTEDLIAKYSKVASDSSQSSKLYNVNLIDVADSFREQGTESVRFNKRYVSDGPDLAQSLSVETMELIKKASSANRDAGASTHGSNFRARNPSSSFTSSSHFVTPSKDDQVHRMLKNAKMFQDYLEQSETLKSTQTHLTPPSSNRSVIQDPPTDAYDEAQRLLSNAKRFEAEINRVALEPEECYKPPSKYGSPSKRYTSDDSSIKSYNTLKSARYASPTKKYTSDYMKHYNSNSCDTSLSSLRSNNSMNNFIQSNEIAPILKDLNLRSKELKELLDRQNNLELTKTSSTWTDVRQNDIDTRLEYLKKRCSDLRHCTESRGCASQWTNFADVASVASQQMDSIVSSPQIEKANSLALINSILDEKTVQSVKPVALKVLSERVLGGYRITRDTCAQCGVSKLAKRDSDQPAECVFCPINDLRSKIRNGVARKILASKILMGSSTLSRGKLCELCVSPTSIQPDGTVVCEVCPVLDTVCLEVAKEQSKGGRIMNGLPCRECGANMVSTNNQLNCVACSVMKEWQQLQLQQEKAKSLESSAEVIQSEELKQQLSTIESSPSEVKANGTMTTELSTAEQNGEANNANPSVASEKAKQKTQEKQKIFESLMGNCGALSGGSEAGNVPLNISNLQSQLLQELAKAKQCQIVLENSIEENEGGDKAPLPKEMEEELAKAKRCQYALERILETTSNMDPTSNKDPSSNNDEFPAVGTPTEIEDMMSAPELKGSFSISQQEVEAGKPKEYIPPPSFFQTGIPSMVEVTLITPEPDTNLARAYETNLKNTDNEKKLVSKSKVGIDFWPFTKSETRLEEEERNRFDYDTIQTDDFTVDYTLNTVDDSRLEYLHIRSKKMNKVRFADEEEEINKEKESNEAGCSFINCFGCGDEDEGRQDTYRRDGESLQREMPIDELDKYRTPIQTNSMENSIECSATSTVSKQVSQPAWIGNSNSKDNNPVQPPVANNDYSEISCVSEHVLRPIPTRPAPPSPGPSGVSDISGSVNRLQGGNSVSSVSRLQGGTSYSVSSEKSGNSGSFVRSYGRQTIPSRNYGGKYQSKMGILREDESIDTSIDKYMHRPSALAVLER